MRPTEIESLAELEHLVAAGLRSLSGFHLQSLDLRDHTTTLTEVDVRDAVFLGCRFADAGPGSEHDVRLRGGLVFPAVPDVPVDVYRGVLYTPAELYDGLDRGYPATVDAAAYAWSRAPDTLDHTLAMALHDHAIDDAVQEFARGHRMVGVMGGHAVHRDSPAYRTAAELGRLLGQRFTVLTGGGPGAMEAANLGARLVDGPPGALDDAVTALAAVPDFAPDITGWARVAFEVLERWPEGRATVGVPTWYYGHEPPNPFASAIAKYFRNALREDMLLRLCRAGIVFLPGAAGTVQEIFQAACTSYYAEPDLVTPMVLVGREYWTAQLPVWELVVALGRGRALGERVHLVDRTEEVLPLLLQEGGDRR